MPRDLHPSLGPGPDPKPVCVSCAKTEADAVLVPLKHPTISICASCAADAHLDASAATILATLEGIRMICFAALQADPTAFMREASV